jgi:hypothetical protein
MILKVFVAGCDKPGRDCRIIRHGRQSNNYTKLFAHPYVLDSIALTGKKLHQNVMWVNC